MHFVAARGPDVAVAIVAIVFVFIYLMVRITTREREQRRRLDLVAQALQSNQLDDRTKRELLAAVGAAPREARIPLWTALGWIGLAVGISLLILGETMSQRDLWAPGVLVTAVSFAVLSLPIAARELQGRRTAPNAPPGRAAPNTHTE